MKRRRFPQLLLFASAAPVRGARAGQASGVAVAKSSIIETQYGKARGRRSRGTANPSQSGSKWPVYSNSQRATMLFDQAKSEPTGDPGREERLMLRDCPSRGLL
jgi:carboxylesterase type B